MSVRTLMVVAGALGAGLVISAIAGPAFWAAAVAVALLAVAAAVRVARRTDGSVSDASGERLSVGDTVRAGAGFDGPMELTFGWGVVVKVGQGKAHVRFSDIPGQVHPVTPSGLRRIS